MKQNIQTPSTAVELETALQRRGITNTAAEKIFNVTRQTIYNWITGKTKIPPRVWLEIVKLDNSEYRNTKKRENQIRDFIARLDADEKATDTE